MIRRLFKVTTFALIMTFTLIGFCSQSTYATATQSSLSVSLEGSEPVINVRPGLFGKSSDTVISVITDNYSGYTLSIASENSTSIVNGNDDEFTSITSAIPEGIFAAGNTYNDKWGYKPNQFITTENNVNTVVQNTNYLPAPSLQGNVLDITSSANVEANTYTISSAVKAGYELPAGDYTYTYVVTAVANLLNYNITYDENTADTVSNMPNPNPQPVSIDGGTPVEDSYATLSSARPTKATKYFGGWCDEATTTDPQSGDDVCGGTLYQPEASYPIDQTAGPNITLYAVWTESLDSEYAITYHYGDIEFNGGRYLDTKLLPFSQANFNTTTEEYKDFQVSFAMESFTGLSGQSSNRNSVISCMNEANKTHYTGFDFRYLNDSNKTFELATNSNRNPDVTSDTTKNKVNYGTPSEFPWNVVLKRVGTKLYLNDIMNMNYVNIVENFNIPLTLGAETENSTRMYRYFKGNLSDIQIKMMYDTGQVTLPEPTLTNYVFLGWSTTPDGSNIVTSIDLSSNTDLYAVWTRETVDGYNVTYNYGDFSFDGTKYLDTKTMLFSDQLYRNDFSISTSLSNFEFFPNQDGNLNSFIFDMNESNTSAYPGFVYRYGASGSSAGYQLVANSSSSNKKTVKDPSNTPIVISRQSQELYVNGNLALSYDDLAGSFNTPLTFGAALDRNLSPYRYAKVDLNDITVDVQYAKGTAVLLPVPSFEGSTCTFEGWTGDNGSTPQVMVTIPSDNTTDKSYTANFDCIESGYEITFNPNDGEVDENSRIIEEGSPIGPLPTPTRTGYTFDGWYLNNTLIDQYYIPDGDIELVAQWTINQYTITFDTGGGTPIAPITQNYGTPVAVPANPTREGFIFNGWSPAIPATMPAESIIITALWVSESSANYNVTYQYGGLELTGQNYLNTNLPLFSTANYDKTNHVYKDFIIDFTLDTLTSGNEDRATLLQCEDESDKTYYPGFVYRYRTSGTKMNFVTYIRGSDSSTDYASTTPQTVQIKRDDNYIFFNGTKVSGDFDNISANFDYPLTFGAAYKSGNMSDPYRRFKGELSNVQVALEYSNADAVTLPTPENVNSGCSFIGWTGSNGATPEINVTIPQGNVQNKTYVANFSCSTNRITLDANGGSVTPDYKIIDKNSAIGTLPTPRRTGYTFDGWYYNDTLIDASYIPSGDIELVAHWAINQYTITFNTDGGSTIAPITQDYGTAVSAPADPTKTGYVFLRWDRVIPDTMPAEDITITALWRSETIEEYNVTYNYGNLDFYTCASYLNTNLQLFSSDVAHNDFEISLNVDSSTYLSGQDNSLNSVFSAMNESGSPYPGLVFRRDATKFSFVYNSTSNNSYQYSNYTNSSIKVKRIDDSVYLNDAENPIIDASDFRNPFNIPLTFGASIRNNNPFRYFKGELSNVTVKQTLDNSEARTVPVPQFVNGDCTFTGWTGSNGQVPQINITIPVENQSDLTYNANFECASRIVIFDVDGGTVSEERRVLNENEEIGTLPIPTKQNYIFAGWYDSGSGGNPISADYVPTNRYTTIYAHWEKAVSLAELASDTLTMAVNGSDVIQITNTAELGESYTFSSNDTNVATVDQHGEVTGVAEGETTIVIKGDTTNLVAVVDVVITSVPDLAVFNATPSAIRSYENNISIWADLSESDYLEAMRTNFEDHNCKMNSDSSIKWASGNVECDKPDGYNTGVNGAVDVYLYDLNNNSLGSKVEYTRSNSGKIYNMIPGQAYYWESQNDSSNNGIVKAIGNRRYIESGVIRNVRDLGGIPVDANGDGTLDGTIKYGKLFRGERLRTTQSDVDTLINLGVNKEIVLSSSGELGSDIKIGNGASEYYKIDTIVHYQIHPQNNTTNYNNARGALTRLMKDVIDGKGVYFHCVYGSDRTGTMAYLIEGLLGANQEQRDRDYEQSGFFGEVDRHRYFSTDIKSSLPKYVHMKTYINDLSPNTVLEWFMYGSTDVASDTELIANFKNAMIDYAN